MQGYKSVCCGIIMYSFQKNKVCELTCLERPWNILYEKEPLQLSFTELRKKAVVVYLCQT